MASPPSALPPRPRLRPWTELPRSTAAATQPGIASACLGCANSPRAERDGVGAAVTFRLRAFLEPQTPRPSARFVATATPFPSTTLSSFTAAPCVRSHATPGAHATTWRVRRLRFAARCRSPGAMWSTSALRRFSAAMAAGFRVVFSTHTRVPLRAGSKPGRDPVRRNRRVRS